KSGERRYSMNRPQGGRFVATNVTVAMLLQTASNVEDFRVAGAPTWVNTDRFDIEGFAGNTTGPANGQFPAMLSSLLADRFQLQTHRETKDASVYFLTVAKGG